MALLGGAEEFAEVRGAFLAFVMLPVEERIGEWRFAGASDELDGAAVMLNHFMLQVGFTPGERDPALLWIEGMGTCEDTGESWSYDKLPLDEIGPRRVVLLSEGGAPYDDCGVCILEAPSLGAFEKRAPETERPDAWPAGDEE